MLAHGIVNTYFLKRGDVLDKAQHQSLTQCNILLIISGSAIEARETGLADTTILAECMAPRGYAMNVTKDELVPVLKSNRQSFIARSCIHWSFGRAGCLKRVWILDTRIITVALSAPLFRSIN